MSDEHHVWSDEDLARLFRSVFTHQPGIGLVEALWRFQERMGVDLDSPHAGPGPWYLRPLAALTNRIYDWGEKRVMNPKKLDNPSNDNILYILNNYPMEKPTDEKVSE